LKYINRGILDNPIELLQSSFKSSFCIAFYRRPAGCKNVLYFSTRSCDSKESVWRCFYFLVGSLKPKDTMLLFICLQDEVKVWFANGIGSSSVWMEVSFCSFCRKADEDGRLLICKHVDGGR
jgi:hypothetical protein